MGIDPETITDAELDEMHGLGVRGVRINLKSTGQELGRDVLGTVAERVRRLGWVVQVYVALEDIEKIADEVPKLGVPVVVELVFFFLFQGLFRFVQDAQSCGDFWSFDDALPLAIFKT